MSETYLGRKICYRCGYPAIHMAKHHRATVSGLVYIHIIVAELKLGRPLKNEEVVHHMDENKMNYDIHNIMIFDNKASHTCYHTCIRAGSNLQLTCIDGVWHCEALDGKIYNESHKQVYKCPVCGGYMVSRTAHMCKLCYSEKIAKNIPTKRQLHRDLKNFVSFAELGRKYNVSDNAVRKWCRKYGFSTHSSDYNGK